MSSGTGKRLGKGLGALFSEFEEEYEASINKATKIKEEETFTAPPSKVVPPLPPQTEEPKPASKQPEQEPRAVSPSSVRAIREDEPIIRLQLEDVYANPNQPRKRFSDEKLRELADSVKKYGVIQPIIVTPRDGKYMIIAGERRYRAATLAGSHEIPAVVRDYSPLQVKEISLIENLQREDLNPIETANAIRQLMSEYHFTQEVIAERISKSRSAVANSLRLLTLAPEVIRLVEEERLSAGHARALVVVEDKEKQFKLAMQAADNKMSVRDLEKSVKRLNKPQEIRTVEAQSIELKELVNMMQRAFATRVAAIGNDRKGRIYIDYYQPDDLDRIHEIVQIYLQHRDKS